MTSKLTELMSGMIEQFPSDQAGVFVLSPDNMKEFRKSTGSFSGDFKGHKVRKVNHAPNDKLYLLNEEEYQGLIEGLKNPIKVINKDKNETNQELD
jgi:hypothetical protein